MKTLRFEIPRAPPGGHVGANLAQVHRRELDLALATHPANEPVLIIIDFAAVHSATASYLKMVWLSLVLTGAEAFRGGTRVLADGPPLREIYVAVSGLNDEVRSELTLIATAEDAVVVEATSPSGLLAGARVIGRVDPAVRETISALLKHRGPASAGSLHASATSQIAATAWNNRLNELCRLRLATRSKAGRQMLYELIAPEVSLG